MTAKTCRWLAQAVFFSDTSVIMGSYVALSMDIVLNTRKLNSALTVRKPKLLGSGERMLAK